MQILEAQNKSFKRGTILATLDLKISLIKKLAHSCDIFANNVDAFLPLT